MARGFEMSLVKGKGRDNQADGKGYSHPFAGVFTLLRPGRARSGAWAKNLTKGAGWCLIGVVRDENYQCHQTAGSANQGARARLDARSLLCWHRGNEILTE